jgi:hypothetical protein
MSCPGGGKRTSGWLAAGIVLLALLAAVCPALSQEEGDTVSVDVQGVAPIRGGDQARARDAAVREALQKSVRQVLMELLGVEDPARLPRETTKLLSRPDRYVDSLSVLQEGPEAGDYHVQLRVAVLSAFLVQDLEKAGVRPGGSADAPRTKVIVRVLGVHGLDGFVRMRNELSAVPGVRKVLPRQVVPGEILLDVESANPPSRLAEQMAATRRFVLRDGAGAPGRLDVEFHP